MEDLQYFSCIIIGAKYHKKGQMDKIMSRIEFENDNNSKKYKVETMRNSGIYTSKWEGHLLSFYYLILWKGYFKEKNI